jgi:hypothetical protein
MRIYKATELFTNKYGISPQELYQTVILNEDYRNLTFEEVQKIAESTKTL